MLVNQKVNLIITQSQLSAFSDYMYAGFIKKAFVRLKEKFPVSTKNITDDSLNLLIREGINKAGKYHIVDRPDVLGFLEYIVVLGNRFDVDTSLPAITKILKIRNLSGSAKMRRINEVHPLNQEFE